MNLLEDLIHCGHGRSSPASLLLSLLDIWDVAALLTTCCAWRDFGDEAWDVLLEQTYPATVPACTKLALQKSSIKYQDADAAVLWKPSEHADRSTSSARVTLFRTLAALRRWQSNRTSSAKLHVLASHQDESPWYVFDREVVLFGDELEFFTALQVLSESDSVLSRNKIQVIVGRTFQQATCRFSVPRLKNRFDIVSFGEEDVVKAFEVPQQGLLAVHPSALADPCIVNTVLLKFPLLPVDGFKLVVGVNAKLGGALAGNSSRASTEFDAAVHWGTRNIFPNGPFLITRSFCNAMYPQSLCQASRRCGFYDVPEDTEERIHHSVGRAMSALQIHERRLRKRSKMNGTSTKKFISFVYMYVTGFAITDACIVPLDGGE